MNNLRLGPAQFNPKESAGRQRHRPLLRLDQAFVEEPESYFLGRWDDRHLLNVPGPFYGAETDTCCDGPPLAPLSLLTDDLGSGFVWRQPRNDDEAHALMTGASSDPFNGFGWDGDEHWTVALIRSWWADRAALQGIVEHLMVDAGPAELHGLTAQIAKAFSEYLHYGLEQDLRRYAHFLETGSYPRAEDRLPQL